MLDPKNLSKNAQMNELLFIQTLFYFDFGWLTDCIKNLTQLLNCSE